MLSKKLLLCLAVFGFVLISFGQNKTQQIHTKFDSNINKPLTTQEKAFINEVYGEYAQRAVYGNETQLKQIKQILRHRVVIEYHEKKDLSSLTPLSQVKLVNDINSNIRRDAVFNPKTFNPLKYDFNFFSRSRVTHYWVDNTQYLITILPQH